MTDSIKKRIFGLMQKTTGNGCTEDEAILAAKKVQELLRKYQLSLSDIKIKESKTAQEQYDINQKQKPMVDFCIVAIGHFTDTKCWRSWDNHGHIQYNFFGLEHDVMIAKYILKICDWAIIHGGEDYKRENPDLPARERASLAKDYQYGMASSLSRRIREMKEEQEADGTGTQLMVVKNAVVEDAFEELGLSLKINKARRRSVNLAAYGDGKLAGDRVALNPGVTGDKSGGYIA